MHTKVKLLGVADTDITQIIGGTHSNYWGIYFPIPPLRGFDTPVGEKMKQTQTNVEETDLWKTIIRVEAQHKAWQHTLPVCRKPIVLVLAQG